MKLWQKIKKINPLRNWRKLYWIENQNAALLRGKLINITEENENLRYGNELLKTQHQALLEAPDDQLKTDLGEAINIIIDYQKTLFRLHSPDPNVQRASTLLNKWNVKSERVHGAFKIISGGKNLTMGREY